MTGSGSFVWLDADGGYRFRDDIPVKVALVCELQNDQLRDTRNGGGGQLRQVVRETCRQIKELEPQRLARQKRISVKRNASAGSGKIETWITPADAGALVGKSAERIVQLCKAKPPPIKARRYGRFWLVERESVYEHFHSKGRPRRAV